MIGLQVDAWARTIREIESAEGWPLKEMYRALSHPSNAASDIDSVTLDEARNRLWIDGEVFLKPAMPVFHVHGYDGVLAGMGLVLGLDRAGNNRKPSISLERLVSMVQWTNMESTGELEPTRETATSIIIGQPILRVRA
jgi:hypothetical protein